MDEAEWLACTDPERMLAGPAAGALRIKARPDWERTLRKRVLFCAAACRLVWHHLLDEPNRRCVEWMERQFDRPFSDEEVDEIVRDVKYVMDNPPDWGQTDEYWQHVGSNLVYDGLDGEVLTTIRRFAGADSADDPERRHHARLAEIMRDIVGNPFAPAALDPAWRTSTVLGLAEAIYAGRAFGNLPVLADALEEAGCTAAGLLEHCRGPNIHVHGCWALDLVLGRGEGAAA